MESSLHKTQRGPLRLNLGSGPHTVPGWTSIDRSPNIVLDRLPAAKILLHRMRIIEDAHLALWPRDIVRRDIRSPLPYRTGSADAIYSSHALEHVFLDEAEAILRECHRVLRPTGILRLALPDAETFARNLVSAADGPDSGRRFNRNLASHPEQRPTGWRRLRSPLASAPHRWQPTESLVSDLLLSAGFIDIIRQTYRTGHFPDLSLVEHREHSLFVEACKA